jgi:hypothetical protein
VVGVETVTIASAGASSFGANVPGFGWLDMEKQLHDAGIFKSRTVASSLGGTRDRGLGMDRDGRRLLRKTIDDYGIHFIDVKEEIASIEERMRIYQERAGGRRFAAYINAGGALVSLGPKSVKRLYEPGVNLRPHPRGIGVDSVTMRFLTQGTPVVNLSKVIPLAERTGCRSSRPHCPTSARAPCSRSAATTAGWSRRCSSPSRARAWCSCASRWARGCSRPAAARGSSSRWCSYVAFARAFISAISISSAAALFCSLSDSASSCACRVAPQPLAARAGSEPKM